MAAEKKIINPWTWQEEWGYDQAIEISRFDRLLIVSGQSANAADGSVQHAGDMRGQLGLVLDNIETILGAAGYSWGDVIETKWYTTDMGQLMESLDVVEARLASAEIRAAGSVYGVSDLAEPGLMVEVEVIAAK